ncbi:MAG: flagellar basal body P-ring protein FlgI [Pelosinus sp.]|nr:flagellar basal body P-ring protein FlgI [Pelosinus sp.]
MRRVAVFCIIGVLTFLMAFIALAAPVSASVRIKDIAKVQGVRSNQLVGYGIVVGLNGTGDTDKALAAMQSNVNFLKAFGVTLTTAQMKTKNAAAVVVTAQLPPFVKPGDTIDITVSSMGDAKGLQGGTLLQTPLRAANGQVYAVGQGAVTTGGFSVSSGGNSQQKNFPTVGLLTNGAIVERDVPMTFSSNGIIRLALNQPDFTTATRITEMVNSVFGSIATPRDPGTVEITVPGNYTDNVVTFVAALEELSVTPDNVARVIINERTGTIVMGSNVTIDEVAVAQGGLSIKISKDTQVSQPDALSGGTTATTTNTAVDVKEGKAGLIVLPQSSSVGDVVNALNAVGATPRDIITILQAIKASGALHADFQVI